MKRLYPPLAALTVAIGLLVGCAAPEAGEAENHLEVFAAASLRDVAQDLATAFRSESNATLAFNFAGSNVLARQILAAPRGQIFLSADRSWVQVLEDRGVAESNTRRQVFSNRLVLVAGSRSALPDSIPQLAALAGLEFSGLVLADPQAVPAGRYARAALEAQAGAGATLWETVASRVMPTTDARAALALVESGTDLVGIVYRTDAIASSRVRVLVDIDPLPNLPIGYWAIAIKGAPPVLSRRFLDFLAGPAAQTIVERHGFLGLRG